MKLSLNQKAMLVTAGILSGALLALFLIITISVNFGMQVLVNIVGIGCGSFIVWALYMVVHSELECLEKRKELNNEQKAT